MERFAVRSGITLTVQHGSNRTACQILIAPEQSLIHEQNPIAPMPSQGVSDVLEELLPAATRGKQINSTTVSVDIGTVLQTDYEGASIRRYGASDSCASSNENQDLGTFVIFKRPGCPK
jgi:hypothetical protein